MNEKMIEIQGITKSFGELQVLKGIDLIINKGEVVSIVVGNIKIGNDVLIAPLSFVNFDVPDHSIVIGNPAKIIHRENATLGYVGNRV